MRIFLALILCHLGTESALSQQPSAPSTYYISPTGSDSASGTSPLALLGSFAAGGAASSSAKAAPSQTGQKRPASSSSSSSSSAAAAAAAASAAAPAAPSAPAPLPTLALATPLSTGVMALVREVLSRLLLLTHLVPSVSYFNVWDLPLSVCRAYLAFVDDWVKARNKGG